MELGEFEGVKRDKGKDLKVFFARVLPIWVKKGSAGNQPVLVSTSNNHCVLVHTVKAIYCVTS